MVDQDGVDDTCHAIDRFKGIGNLPLAHIFYRHDQLALRLATVNLHARQRLQPLLYCLHPFGASLNDKTANAHGKLCRTSHAISPNT